ncbi:MAG TPA: YigZ family protein [Anaerolineae bacterium]|nr:YigZ family protein [Anaerolineae bacterium]
MGKRYIPAKRVRSEIEVLNSRFIATLGPVFTVEEAKAFIAEVKAEFADATHNVPLFVVGHGGAVTAHCSDDGEPSGTAGRPALAVLQGSGLGDVAAVVTRYYGGTKLGTGGLVRAYGDAIRAVLEDVRWAEKVATVSLLLSMPYSWLEQVRLLVEEYEGVIEEEDFGVDVMMEMRLRRERREEFEAALTALTHGQLEALLAGEDEATIMLVEKPEGD